MHIKQYTLIEHLILKGICILLLLTSTSGVLHAKALFTATCSSLEGAKVSLKDGEAKIEAVNHLAPIFFVDKEEPNKLVSLWTRETTDKYESVIIFNSNDKLHAVEMATYGIDTYTLYFKTGVLHYTNHRSKAVFDDNPDILAFVGKCDIIFGH